MSPRRRRITSGVAWALAVSLLGAAASGCYTRTIRAEGIGTSRVETQEPYAEDWPFETIDRELKAANRPPKWKTGARHTSP